ncbi:hypothetical protein PG995_004624 [Apiospora arundinis]
MAQELEEILGLTDNNGQATSFIKYLKNCLPVVKGPNSLSKSWDDIQAIEEITTPKIFATKGCIAWCAYFLVSHRTKTSEKYKFKAECRQFLDNLESEPADVQSSIADSVCALIADDSQLAQELRKLEIKVHRKKRSSTAIDGDGTESIPQNANKRHRTSIDDDHETGPEAAEGALPAAAENITPVQLITTSLILRLDTSGRLPGFYPRPGILDVPGQLARRKAQRLFPSALMDAIVRYPASNPEEDCEVGVKMCFVEGNDFGFIIEFELDDLEGPRYTKDWFDLELRTHGQMRYIQHRNRQICRVSIWPRECGQLVLGKMKRSNIGLTEQTADG